MQRSKVSRRNSRPFASRRKLGKPRLRNSSQRQKISQTIFSRCNQSNQVDQLAAQAKEVVVEVAKIEAMVQAFQGKVCATAQTDPEPTSSK